MRSLVTMAVALGLVGLTAEVGSAQNVLIDKINFKPAPPMAPPGTLPTVQPEGLVFEQPGFLDPTNWKIVVTFGKINPDGSWTKFDDSPVTDVIVAVPTLMNGTRWRLGGAQGIGATWAANGIYYCQADLKSAITKQGPWISKKTYQLEVK